MQAQKIRQLPLKLWLIALSAASLAAFFMRQQYGVDISAQYLNLDGGWYARLAQEGYDGQAPEHPWWAGYAFFPGWPMVLRLVAQIFRGDLPIQLLGAIVASIIYLGTLVRWGQPQAGAEPGGLRPRTGLGLAFFVFSPGAWIYFTNHTESLFLAFSWGSFIYAYRTSSRSHFWLASILGGLAALTRNQGIFVAACSAIALAIQAPPRQRLRLFVGSGLISGALYALWPLYQWWHVGNPLMSMQAQSLWNIETSVGNYLRNLVWIGGSRWQRRLVFWLTLGFGIKLMRVRQSFALGLYVLTSGLLWPLQGNSLGQAFRFSAVLFPLWFSLGDGISALVQVKSWGRALQYALAASLLLGSAAMATHYFYILPDKWPY